MSEIDRRALGSLVEERAQLVREHILADRFLRKALPAGKTVAGRVWPVHVGGRQPELPDRIHGSPSEPD